MNTHQREALEFSIDHGDKLDHLQLIKMLAHKDAELLVELADIDVSAVVAKLLQQKPDLFLKFAKQQVANFVDGEEVLALLKRDEVIAAIKLLREKLGIGLKEAKDIIDNVRAEAFRLGLVSSAPTIPAALTDPQLRQAAEAIIATF